MTRYVYDCRIFQVIIIRCQKTVTGCHSLMHLLITSEIHIPDRGIRYHILSLVTLSYAFIFIYYCISTTKAAIQIIIIIKLTFVMRNFHFKSGQMRQRVVPKYRQSDRENKVKIVIIHTALIDKLLTPV